MLEAPLQYTLSTGGPLNSQPETSQSATPGRHVCLPGYLTLPGFYQNGGHTTRSWIKMRNKSNHVHKMPTLGQSWTVNSVCPLTTCQNVFIKGTSPGSSVLKIHTEMRDTTQAHKLFISTQRLRTFNTLCNHINKLYGKT
jgi:hypothetical protein